MASFSATGEMINDVAPKGGSGMWEALAIVASNILGALSYKEPDHQYSAQEQAYGEMIDKYRSIGERRSAAIKIASGISGLPEETFYGRRGQKLMQSDLPVGTKTAEEAKQMTDVNSKVKTAVAPLYEQSTSIANQQPNATTTMPLATAAQVKGAANVATAVSNTLPSVTQTYAQAMSSPEARSTIDTAVGTSNAKNNQFSPVVQRLENGVVNLYKTDPKTGKEYKVGTSNNKSDIQSAMVPEQGYGNRSVIS